MPDRAWHPTPAVWVSLVWHAGCLLALTVQPAWWPWALAGIAANHALLALAGLWPQSALLGPTLARLPPAAQQRGEICLTFDDGPDALVTPRVLDLLDTHRAKASFFCIGERAACLPQLVAEIERRGHSVENHSHRHSWLFACFGLHRLQRDVGAAQEAIAAAARVPQFFRPPIGLRNILLDPVLARYGLRCVAWTRRARDGVRVDPTRALARLTTRLSAGDILLLHDTAPAGVASARAPVLEILPPLLAEIRARNLHAVTLPQACDATRR